MSYPTITVPRDEAEALVNDLDGAVSEILDAMIISGSQREELFSALMKIASARYFVKDELSKSKSEGEADHG